VRGFELGPEDGDLVVRVPPDLGFFAGHFDGAPIVPGAALLQLVLQQLPAADVATLQRVRFLRAVGPGAVLRLSLQASGGGETTFRLDDGVGTVASGLVQVGGP
jgi:3-hydroxymyristoyl/3-hydroxydecanoyl-(acyl carrier protein) dehydratase